MFGLYLEKDDEFIEKVSKNGEELRLLAKGDGVEIMNQRFQADLVFWLDPGDNERLMEFFYILEGTVSYKKDNDEVKLTKGDYFYVHSLKESVYFKTLTDVSLLYISSQPIFHLLSNEIEVLSEMLKKVEGKDMYTHSHGMRLKDLSIKIGENMKLSQKQLDILFYSALFHDIGKINVPDEILKKPGKLTNEEFEYIKKHPADGADIIKNTFLREAVPGILQHQERLDGSGYPMGLKEEEICLEAKIIAVVDTYDAMTSDRPYRKGMDPKAAINEMKSLIGKHYDEKIVRTFEQILKEEKVI
ncbi:HD domain protein [Clostridiales bacterium oral taxon 876 str. F0540]|nr:HD domain protein [Clostridiales bacterium oral taxon 876 str. F0540]